MRPKKSGKRGSAPKPAVPTTGPEASSTREAFERVRPQMESLPEELLVPITFEIPSAVAMVLGLRAQLAALRELISSQLPHFDRVRFDALGDYALATLHAHQLHVREELPAASRHELGTQVSDARDRFLFDVDALTRRGLLPSTVRRSVSRRSGYQSTATDVLYLVDALRAHWPAIEGRTALQEAELDAAQNAAMGLLCAVGEGRIGSGPSPAGLLRQQACTLFVRAYEDARRASHFLRWFEPGKKDCLPSLHSAGRSTERRRFTLHEPATVALREEGGPRKPSPSTAQGPVPGSEEEDGPEQGAMVPRRPPTSSGEETSNSTLDGSKRDTSEKNRDPNRN